MRKYQERPARLGLAEAMALRPTEFRWQGDGRADVGLIAEDVEAVSPLLVTRFGPDPDQVQINRNGLLALLAGAVQAQQEQIDALREEVRDLRSR